MVSPSISDETDQRFEETAWSMVLAAGASTPARAHTAMAELCRIYWRPIYAYLRRSGYSRHDAEDLTQSFFSAPFGKRDAPARFSGARTFPQFPPRSAEALPCRRAHAATHLETRRPNAIHLDGRARGRGAPSPARRS